VFIVNQSESGKLCDLLESFTGQDPPQSHIPDICPLFPEDGIGYSQLNELLLIHGFDRIAHAFFQFLSDGTLEYKPGASIKTIDDFALGVDKARKLFLLFFGNVKFGFKKLASDAELLSFYLESTQPIDPEAFAIRHSPVYPIEEIPSSHTYYLGYVIQQELEKKLQDRPNDEELRAQQRILDEVRQKGIRNQNAYLVSDHLDVYIATSMRRRHEYLEVADFGHQVFASEKLQPLKLRWFDPTQAYCADRIDKGLAEALMLKRAACTLYLAQESDTLGKDSELASTLAQGKPVIAYLPCPEQKDVIAAVDQLARLYGKSEVAIILERLQVFAPDSAWNSEEVRSWLKSEASVDKLRAMELLIEKTREHYDTRARTLRESHPLGIQVNLDTGVANGVLVVRTIADCAELIYRIITKTLAFRIEEKAVGKVVYHLLRETVSDSVFRVMTGDAMLTNSFWNFYLEPSEF
jgi:hypothetical protein